MALPQNQFPDQLSEAEYLEFEDRSEFKYEFADGEVIAMTGASLRHNIIANNLATMLNNQLRDKDCIVPSNDTRLKVESMKSYRYPDVMVICGEPQLAEGRQDTISNPTLIVEVLSPSTELIDRNPKLKEYRQIETLTAYVLVAQAEVRIEAFMRHEVDTWLYKDVSGIENSLYLTALDVTLELADIYRKALPDSD